MGVFCGIVSESSKDTQQVSDELITTVHTHRQRKMIFSMGVREIVWALCNQVIFLWLS